MCEPKYERQYQVLQVIREYSYTAGRDIGDMPVCSTNPGRAKCSAARASKPCIPPAACSWHRMGVAGSVCRCVSLNAQSARDIIGRLALNAISVLGWLVKSITMTKGPIRATFKGTLPSIVKRLASSLTYGLKGFSTVHDAEFRHGKDSSPTASPQKAATGAVVSEMTGAEQDDEISAWKCIKNS